MVRLTRRFYLCIFFTCVLAVLAEAQLPSGQLVAWYPFNGNANDGSGNSNNGTVNGASLTTDRFNNANSAYEFDGNNDYILITDDDSLSFPDEKFTIAFWMYNYANANSDGGIISKRIFGGTQGQWEYSIHSGSASTALNFYAWNDGGACTAFLDDDPVWTTNTWTHYVWVADGDTAKLYRDGKIMGMAPRDTACQMINAGGDVAIGVGGGFGQNAYFDGKIDDLGIWSRALTPCEIRELYTGDPFFLVVSNAANAYNGYGVQCYNDSNGIANLTITGGVGCYSYLWTNGSTDSTATDLWPGNHFVEVTDTNGCFTVSNIAVITEPDPLILAYGGQFDPLCNGDTTSLVFTFTTQNGAGGLTYLWSNGDTTPILTNVGAGTYKCVVTDVNGCKDSLDAFVNDPPALFLSVDSVTGIDCGNFPTGKAWTTAGGGSGPITYLWSDGSSGDSATTLPGGQNYVTIVDTNGCILSDTFIVNSAPPIIFNFDSLVNVLCFGDSTGFLQASPAGGTGNLSWTWSNGDSTAAISGLTAGSYLLTITDSIGCTVVDSMEVNQPPPFNVTKGSTTDTVANPCSGTAFITVSGSTPPYSISWSDSAQQTSDTATGLCAGIYTFTITDTNGCVYSDTVMVATTINREGGLSRMPFEVYPNPSNGRITVSVKTSGDHKVDVIDLLGNRLHTYPLDATAMEIDLSELSSGMYFIRLRSGNQSGLKPIIIKH